MSQTTPTLQPDAKVLTKVGKELVTATFVRMQGETAIVSYGGKLYGRVLSSLQDPVAQSSFIVDRETSQPEVSKPLEETYSVKERIDFSEMLCDSVVEGMVDSMIICGSPGMGKSRLVIDRMEHHELGACDTITHKGYITPKGLYEMLYHNSDKLIVFDDCDSIFANDTSANVLKAALDTYETRIVSWGSSSESSVPNEFEFRGRMICITNHRLQDVPAAFTSRSVYVDLTMNAEEKIERIHQIGDKLCPWLKSNEVKECIDLLDEHKNRIKNLNLRTMQMVGKIRQAQPAQWSRVAKYMVLAK